MQLLHSINVTMKTICHNIIATLQLRYLTTDEKLAKPQRCVYVVCLLGWHFSIIGTQKSTAQAMAL